MLKLGWRDEERTCLGRLNHRAVQEMESATIVRPYPILLGAAGKLGDLLR